MSKKASIYLNNEVILDDVRDHANNQDIHVSPEDRTFFQNVESRLSTLEDDEAGEGVVRKSTFREHVLSDVHLTASQKSKINASYEHISASNLHVTKEQKDGWDASIEDLSNQISQIDGHIDDHLQNQYIHVTTNDKLTWNRKYDMPRDAQGNILGIPYSDFNAETKALIDNKASWHYEYDKDNAGNITKTYGPGWSYSDLLPSVQAEFNKKINSSDLLENGIIKDEYLSEGLKRGEDIVNHLDDTTLDNPVYHVSSAERTLWNNSFQKVGHNYGSNFSPDWDYGIKKSQLDRSLANELNAKANTTDLIGENGLLKDEYLSDGLKRGEDIVNHLDDASAQQPTYHITSTERTMINNSFQKVGKDYGPSGSHDWDYGLKWNQLDREVTNKINDSLKASVVLEDGIIKDEYLSEGLRRGNEIIEHIENGDIHISSYERSTWNNTFQKIEKDYGTGGNHDLDYGLKWNQLDREVTNKINDSLKASVVLQDGVIKDEYLSEGLRRGQDIIIHLNDASSDNPTSHVTADEKALIKNSVQKQVINYGSNADPDYDYGIKYAQLDRSVRNAIDGKVNSTSLFTDGKIKSTLINQKELDHYYLRNKGNYSHADIDYHIENDNIHSSATISKWDYRGSQFAGSEFFDNIDYDIQDDIIRLTVDQTATEDTTNNPDGKTIYEVEGYMISSPFDTKLNNTVFQAIDFYGSYDEAFHDIKIYTRTGSTDFWTMDTDENGDYYWEQDWVETDHLHNIHSESNRYIQFKVELHTSDEETTPRISKFTLFYGAKVNDEIEKAQGDYSSIDERFINLEESYNIELTPTPLINSALDAIFVLPEIPNTEEEEVANEG